MTFSLHQDGRLAAVKLFRIACNRFFNNMRYELQVVLLHVYYSGQRKYWNTEKM